MKYILKIKHCHSLFTVCYLGSSNEIPLFKEVNQLRWTRMFRRLTINIGNRRHITTVKYNARSTRHLVKLGLIIFKLTGISSVSAERSFEYLIAHLSQYYCHFPIS